MCCRYYLDTKESPRIYEAVIAAIKAAEKLDINIKASGDVRPNDIAPVIAPSAVNRNPISFPMKWGFAHPRRNNILIFNTRCETAAEKGLFCTSVDERRCLIPVSGYYEWKKQNKTDSKKYLFTSETPIYLAGLYVRSSKALLPCFSILTMDSPDMIKEIHNRMPVIVTEEQKEAWLGGILTVKDAFEWSFGKERIHFQFVPKTQ